MSTQVILGVDIGTTSVKVCLIDATTREELASESKDTQSSIPAAAQNGSPAGAHEQNVRKIVSTLHNCILRLPKDILKHVKHIGICGQMHGIVMWRSPAWTDRFELVNEHISNLVTWQDTRCDHTFLATLPRPDSHLRAYTGYGVNTLLWLTKHEPTVVAQYTHAATIQDFIVAMLCDLEDPVMCNQNAASWGYFNCAQDSWNEKILIEHEPQFPLHLLPKIQPSGTIVGNLTRDWLGIPKDTPIHVALGDLQCSVLATLQYGTDAIVNISTSAQIAFIDESFQPEDHYETEKGDRTELKIQENTIKEVKNIKSIGLTEDKIKIVGEIRKQNTEPTETRSIGTITDQNSERIEDSETEKAKRCDFNERLSKSFKDTLEEIRLFHDAINTQSKDNSPFQGTINTRSNDNKLFNETTNAQSTIYTTDFDSDVVGYDEVDPIGRQNERSVQGVDIRPGKREDGQTSRSEATPAPSIVSNALDKTSRANHIEHFPYFGGKYIAVGASMNGGNCLATFICTLQAWFKEFGFNVPQNQIWSKLINGPESLGHIARYETDLKIIPTLLGDRHVTEESASILNITAGNLNVNSIFLALCRGIISNLHAIMNRQVLHESRITRIIGIGSCLSRNHILQHYVESEYGLKLVLENQMRDASYGAALSTIL